VNATSLPRFEIGFGQPGYPAHLAETPDPPHKLYGIGDPSALCVGLSVVGARRATPYGLKCAQLFAGWAADAGYTIVSGAAIGCDQAAHRAALDVGGQTVAVLAGGADIAYPAGAARLLGEVAATGAVVSEHPWGTPPQKWTFRTRNRIIAGLSAALLVVEARVPSGTFSTADYALEAGREVFAVPGSVFSAESAGPNRLIRQGAMPVTDASELAFALEALIGPRKRAGQAGRFLDAPLDDPLLSALLADPMRPDDAARALGIDIVSVTKRLGALEISGLIKRYRDGRYGPG